MANPAPYHTPGRACLALLLCTVVVGATARADQVTLEPTKDNTIYEEGNLSNGEGPGLFAGVNGNSNTRRALLAFDVGSAIPAGSTITSVQLALRVTRSIAGTETMALHRLVADWGEGGSSAPMGGGVGAPAEQGEATWCFRFFGMQPWNAAGGDFAAQASATRQVGNSGTVTWGSTAQMIADVQGWLDGPGTNFGWIVRGNEAQSTTAKRFASRETSASTRPKLTIEFDSPGGATATPTNTLAPSATASATATHPPPSATAAATSTRTRTATVTVSATRTATSTAASTGTPPVVPSATSTGTRTATVTAQPTSTATVTAAATGTGTVAPSLTRTGTRTATVTVIPTGTATGAASPASTRTRTATVTASATGTAPVTVAPTDTATGAPSATPTSTVNPTGSPPATLNATATVTATPVGPTPTATDTPSARACTGDCDAAGGVSISELITGVNIALGSLPLDRCPAFDPSASGGVEINELIAAVNNALNGCL